MISLASPSCDEEQMDALDLDVQTYTEVLGDLARINRWTFTAWPTLAFLKRAVSDAGQFSLLDVGFGNGDILRTIARWAKRRDCDARLVGVDLNSRSAPIASAATPPEMQIDYRTGDYADQPERYDYIVSSQVAHHMTDKQLVAFLRYMESRAERGWLILDLHRHHLAYHAYPLLARMLRVHRIVREDGQLSIARSLRPHEWTAMLRRAGISPDTVRIRRRFPFRIAIERIK